MASPATPPRPNIGFRTDFANPLLPPINRDRCCRNSFRTLFTRDPRTPSLRLETTANHPETPIESQCNKDNTSTRESPESRQRHNTAQTTSNTPHPVSIGTECSSENGLSISISFSVTCTLSLSLFLCHLHSYVHAYSRTFVRTYSRTHFFLMLCLTIHICPSTALVFFSPLSRR